MNFSVVILHYETIDDTRECITSLIDNNKEFSFDIIVVDNGSSKGKISSSIMQEFDSSRIHYLISETNLGFAGGNNLGFNYAKNKLNSDCIILANNDLIFTQIGFLQTLSDYLEKNMFDVAGPKIVSLVDGKNQNPVKINFDSVHDAIVRKNKFQVLLFLNYFGMDRIIRNVTSRKVCDFIPGNGEKFQLHGACLIFGPRYIQQFDGLYSGTFMYLEEDFLIQRIFRYKLEMRYIPSLCVMHKEGSSTNATYSKPVKARRFYYKWSIDSLTKLIRYMKGKIQD